MSNTPKISTKTQILPRVDHIDLTVKDLSQTKLFYKKLFVNFLDWKIHFDNEDYFMIGVDANGDGFRLGFIQNHIEFKQDVFNRYRVGLHHFAIQLNTKEAINNVYKKLLDLKVKILDEPKFYTQYDKIYYAVFFEDLNGFKMEFMCYERQIKFFDKIDN
jgi:catechol 2,3-dioxygenase-like lactoylglutathione lyase family enzyme